MLVSGRVQGVWYRGACRQQALALGLAGWAANLDDGRVEVVAEGPEEAVARLEAWCAQGPPAARVRAVVAEDEAETGLEGFETR